MSARKKVMIRLMVGLILYVLALIADYVLSPRNIPGACMFLPAYLVVGYDILLKALKGITRGRVFDENFLMSIATIGAFLIGEYTEGVAVMFFYQVGELFQSYAVGRSRDSIAELMNIRPDRARVIRDGKEEEVDPESVEAGDIILVKPGERIPLDGVIVKGETSLNTSALTGESMPVMKRPGDEVLSGCINLNGLIEIKCLKRFYDSTVSKILDLVENASDKKSKAENFITRFARYYTPAVVLCAFTVAVIPSLITGRWEFWLHKALAFLVVSCPCALVISVPLSFFGGIGGASKRGILIKGGNYMEQLSKVSVMALDKTGTLTKGSFSVVRTEPEQRREEILKYAAIAESASNHPIALSIRQAAGEIKAEGYEIFETAGEGVRAKNGSEEIIVGNERFMLNNGIKILEKSESGTTVYVAHNKEYTGRIIISDVLKEDARDFIIQLRSLGITPYMLTGDNEKSAHETASETGIENYESSLLPGEKMEKIEELISVEKPKKRTVSFVGDGINDAPVLRRSDVGIAMGGIGSDSAIEAADIVIMQDKLSSIITAVNICKKTMKLVYQNIIFSIAVKTGVMILAVIADLSWIMWLAVFADVGVTVIAILNAMRALSFK